MTQQLTGDATEDEFSQARMTVAADNQQIGAHVGRVVQQEIRCRTASQHGPDRLSPNPVVDEVARDVDASDIIGRRFLRPPPPEW